jgi:hypothetical protein
MVLLVEITMDPTTSFVRAHSKQKSTGLQFDALHSQQYSSLDSNAEFRMDKSANCGVKATPFDLDSTAHACCGAEDLTLSLPNFRVIPQLDFMSVFLQEISQSIFQPPKA